MSNKKYLPCPEDENPFPDLDEDEYDDEEYARNLGDISELPAESGILGVDNISSVIDLFVSAGLDAKSNPVILLLKF